MGKDVGFYKILDHFTKLFESKYNKDLKKFVQGEFPALIDGQLGSLFHGVIQLGYGYAAESDQVDVHFFSTAGVRTYQHRVSPLMLTLLKTFCFGYNCAVQADGQHQHFYSCN